MKPIHNPNHSWDTPAFEIVKTINYEALQWQISQALKTLTDDDWAILMRDPTLETDAALNVCFYRVYDRVMPSDHIGCVPEFDKAFDDELNRQLAELLAIPIAA